jgi:hypothetical protein
MKIGSACIAAFYVKDGQNYTAIWEWDIDENDTKYNPVYILNGVPQKGVTVEERSDSVTLLKQKCTFYDKEASVDTAVALASKDFIK